MWDKIRNLAILRDTERCLRRQQSECRKPIITDMDRMPQIMAWYDEFNTARETPLRKGCPSYNFIAIAVLLYYFIPSSLASYTIPRNCRRRISELLGCEPTFISHKKNDILFLYMKDKQFQREMNEAIGFIQKRVDAESASEQ